MKKSTGMKKVLMSALILSTLTYIGCQKNADTSNPNDPADVAAVLQSGADESVSEVVFDDVNENVMGVDPALTANEDLGAYDGIGVFKTIGLSSELGRMDSGTRCFTVTVVPNTPGVFPKTVTINFGTGCTGPDGKTRKGKIITVYSNRMVVPGAIATTTFDGYYVDSFKVEGTHKVTNVSTPDIRAFNRTVIEGKITNVNSGFWRKWNATHTLAQVEGLGTPRFPVDDVFKLTGAGRGENSNGRQWASEITDPLYRRFRLVCPWVYKGNVRFRVNAVIGDMNYTYPAGGQCDNKALLTINGNSQVITLP